jgi:hypothetical protein
MPKRVALDTMPCPPATKKMSFGVDDVKAFFKSPSQASTSLPPSFEAPIILDPDSPSDMDDNDIAIALSRASEADHDHSGDVYSEVPPGQPDADESDVDDDDIAASLSKASVVDREPPEEPTEWPDRQPDSLQPDARIMNGSGMEFSLKVNQWVESTKNAIINRKGVARFREEVGAPLDEANLARMQQHMSPIAAQQATQSHAGVDDSKLNEADRLVRDRLHSAKEGFEAKSYLGNMFRKFLSQSPKDAEEYKRLPSRAAVSEFRKNWAAGELKKWEEKHTYEKSWSRVDTTKGNYKNFAKLVVDLGGWASQEALQGAITLAQKCLCMGAPWLHIHPQTELVEFLVLEFGYTEQFKNSWSTFCSDWSNGDLSASGERVPPQAAPVTDQGEGTEDVDGTQGDGDKQKGKGKGKAKSKAKAKAKANGGKQTGKGEEEESPKAKATKVKKEPVGLDIDGLDIAGLWKEGKSMKTKYEQAISTYQQLCDQVKNDPALSGSATLTKVAQSHDDLKIQLSDWHKQFLMMDPQKLKKEHPTAKCETELASFLRLGKHIDRLHNCVSSVYRAHGELSTAMAL